MIIAEILCVLLSFIIFYSSLFSFILLYTFCRKMFCHQ